LRQATADGEYSCDLFRVEGLRKELAKSERESAEKLTADTRGTLGGGREIKTSVAGGEGSVQRGHGESTRCGDDRENSEKT